MKTKNIITLATIASIFAGCGSVSRDNFQEKFNSPLEQIIYYASLAGNSHNTQPWFVYVENDSLIHIKADFSRKLHIVDPDARGLFISLGAFIENLELTAGSLGYKADIKITAQQKNDSEIATIHLTKSQKSEYDLSKIENRRTLRNPFHKTEISKEHLNKLINSNDSGIIYFPSASPEGKFIAEQTLAAYTQQAKDDQAKQELASWVRFSNSDVEKHRDGLTTSGMGITGLGGFFVRNFYKPEDSMKESFIMKGIEKTKEQTENCGGWILLMQNDDSPKNWIKTGRLYQRLNLSCRDMMIGLHPMNQMIEEENFEINVKGHLSLPGVIQFVARIGYVNEYPPANSVRRSVKEIIKYVQ
jgi:hypothetical protein